MPPKRATRAASQRPRTPAKASNDDDVDTSAMFDSPGVVRKVVMAGPAKFSTAYGSPLAWMPERAVVGRKDNKMSSVLDTVLDTIKQDNEADARKRAEREAQEAARTGRVTPSGRVIKII
jgi:hypothetical protein